MSDWTPLNQIDTGEATPQPAIGDIWVDRRHLKHPEKGYAWVTDTLPFTPKDAKPKPVERVCVEFTGGRREWLTVGELRKRFMYRRRA